MSDDELFGEDGDVKIPDVLGDEDELGEDDLEMGTDEDEDEDELGASHLGAMGFGIEDDTL